MPSLIWVNNDLFSRVRLFRQLTFQVRGLILVNDALVGHFVDDRHGFFEGGLGGVFVLLLHGLQDLFDVGAQHGTQTGVVLAMVFRLTRALLCLYCISQNRLLGIRDVRKARTMLNFAAFVNVTAFNPPLIP